VSMNGEQELQTRCNDYLLRMSELEQQLAEALAKIEDMRFDNRERETQLHERFHNETLRLQEQLKIYQEHIISQKATEMPIIQLEAARIPEGWQLVPIEPTDEMQLAACKLASPGSVNFAPALISALTKSYKAMLAAVVQPK
jgi:TolA-binding protein